jgi:hypothetical protein
VEIHPQWVVTPGKQTNNNLLVEKGDAISILTHSFPENLPSIKILPITEAEIKRIIQSLKPIRSSGYFEISKISKD